MKLAERTNHGSAGHPDAALRRSRPGGTPGQRTTSISTFVVNANVNVDMTQTLSKEERRFLISSFQGNGNITVTGTTDDPTDPNGGVTYGVLPVWLFTDDKGEITNIFAPDINANSTLGPGTTTRMKAVMQNATR